MDQHSNNVSLFSLVEQINVPPGAPPPPRGLVPLEVHAYFALSDAELHREFQIRFVLGADSGLETPSDVMTHRSVTPRFRTRTAGVPFPPAMGNYDIRLDWRASERESWNRSSLSWPLAFVEHRPEPPRVTH